MRHGRRALSVPAQPVLLPVRAFVDRGTTGVVRDPRARARACAGRHPRRPVRAQPRLPRAGRATARSAGGDPRARRERRRGRAAAAGLELPPDPALERALEHERAHREVPRGEAVGLEDQDVFVELPPRELPADDLVELVHLEPVEHARLYGFDQIARLALRVLDRVAADERSPLEHDVVELASARVVRADRADERAGPQPLAAQHGVARGRHGDDDVLGGCLPVALAGLRADLPAELRQPLLVPAVGDHGLEGRQRRANRRYLAAGLPAAADQAERGRALAREVLRSHTARGAGAQLSESVGLDHGYGSARLGREQEDDEGRAVAAGGVRLQAGQTELPVDRPHHCEKALLVTRALSWHVLDRARGEPPEATFHRLERILGRQQVGDLRLRQVQRQRGRLRRRPERSCRLPLRDRSKYRRSWSTTHLSFTRTSRTGGYCFWMKLIWPLVSSTAQRTSSSEPIWLSRACSSSSSRVKRSRLRLRSSTRPSSIKTIGSPSSTVRSRLKRKFTYETATCITAIVPPASTSPVTE